MRLESWKGDTLESRGCWRNENTGTIGGTLWNLGRGVLAAQFAMRSAIWLIQATNVVAGHDCNRDQIWNSMSEYIPSDRIGGDVFFSRFQIFLTTDSLSKKMMNVFWIDFLEKLEIRWRARMHL